MLTLLARHPIVEPLGRAEDETDQVLIGLTQLTHALIAKRAEFKRAVGPALIELLMRALFDIATPQNFGEFAPPHCKSKV